MFYKLFSHTKMINNYLERQIKEFFPFQPTFQQEIAIKRLTNFLISSDKESVFILRGYAGTGKTSLVGALVKALTALKQGVVLLAPTGRAAKVFAGYAKHSAYTIHKKIYRQQQFSNDTDAFSINDNLLTHTLFIVDEASMISNDGLSGATFGTGRLLDDLVQFVYSGMGCRLLLMGDTAQLPPVGEEESPALSNERFKGYGFTVSDMDLTEVLRQEQSSGVLWNATKIRQQITSNHCYVWPKFKILGFADIKLLSGGDFIDALTTCYEKDEIEESIVICRSNKRANLYNKGIRAQILWREDELNTGDLLMIAKNNYYWSEQYKEIDFIANGETAVVRRVRRNREMYGFRFADVTLYLPDCDLELEANVLLDTLHADAPALAKSDSDRLYYDVLEDYSDVLNKRDRIKKMKADPYYNALQVKYAYAITCHKAQGGQWKNVFLDQGYLSQDYLSPDYFRWLYTAFTRATQTLYLVNCPREQIE